MKKASNLWNAWFGKDKYHNQPVPGGIAEMEACHKTSWSVLYDPTENKAFLRSKCIIKQMMEEKEIVVVEEEFFKIMDKAFRSVANF